MSTGDWWSESWTPVVGCDMSLPCAERCWARRWAHRLKSNPKTAEKYWGITDATGRWTSKVRLDERELERPLHWREPRVVAVSLMGDIFLAPDEVLDRVYAVMALCPQHRFVVLTKRAERRWAYLSTLAERPGNNVVLSWTGERASVRRGTIRRKGDQWPLPNVIEMVSVSTQAELNDRWPWLAKTPAVMRGIHAEPLLGALNLTPCLTPECPYITDEGMRQQWYESHSQLGWIVAGGETGPGARPMYPQWVRKVRDDCAAARVPFWLKGWGEWIPESQMSQELFVKEFHGGVGTVHGAEGNMVRVGRKNSGRQLDGREHNEVPWA